MTPGEFREYAAVMREFGISQLKMGDVEWTMGSTIQPIQQEQQLDVPLDAPSAQEDPIKHKIEAMTSLLKLSDHDLVDQLFPDHQEQSEDEV